MKYIPFLFLMMIIILLFSTFGDIKKLFSKKRNELRVESIYIVEK